MVVAGSGIGFQRYRVNRFQQMQGFVLGKMSGNRVVGPGNCVPQSRHMLCFFGAEAKRVIPFRAFGKKVCRRLDGQGQIVLNHHIGKEIVVGNAAVFIRTLAE